MSRDLTAGMSAEIVKAVVTPILLFEAVLADGSTVRYWTGVGTLTWNSQSWLGTGALIGLGQIDETDDIKAQSASVTVNGVPSSMVSLFAQSLGAGKQGIVRLAMLNSSNAVIADPKIIFRGRLDGATIDEKNVESPVATLTYEHELADLKRPREWRYTAEHQKKLYPGDLGLDHIAALQDAEIPFGDRAVRPGSGP
jgi:hypothetical protein